MAHIGKSYKLQFRRDLANVTNNRLAYPEAFRWSSSNTNGAVAADLINHVVPLVNTATNAQPPMVWQSAPRTAGGVSYIARLTLDDPFDISKCTFKFEVIQQPIGPNLFTFTVSGGHLNGDPSGFNGSATTGFTDSPLYRIVAGNFFWNMSALGWAGYNP